MEIDATRQKFGFTMNVLILTIRITTVKFWVVTDLKLTLDPSLTTVNVFDVFLT